jgi:glutamate-ammonia-ligase adenylyltransferase
VKPLVRSFLAGLETDAPDTRALETVGEPDPVKAGKAFLRAACHPDLRATREKWVPVLLLTARPGFAAQCLDELATRYRQTLNRPLDPIQVPALPHVLGSSDFLARLLLRHPHWIDELVGDPPDPPRAAVPEPDWTAIRIAKYQGLLRITARDLLGRPFEQSLHELSELADHCLEAALACAARETRVAPPTLCGLGKLGGRELNFSSDVDLLFIYEAEPGPADLERNEEVTRLIQVFKRHLEVASEDGFAYRVDLDLRPEGRSGALANSVGAALHYYETFGADWERQMLIRLRYVAGSRTVAETFASQLTPFVYRGLIDPGAIRALRDMKQRIEAEQRAAGRDVEADLKSGPGGIRDVEFLVQALQLLFGRRHPEIRTGNVLEALTRLRELVLLPEAAVAGLQEAYLWLRRAEHTLQLVEERQTHHVPRAPQSQVALARRMGYRDEDGTRARDRLLDDWTSIRARVREQFNALILEPSDEPKP